MDNLKQTKLLTPQEVADFFRIKKETVYTWKCLGKIKCVKVHGKLLFRQEDIEKMVA